MTKPSATDLKPEDVKEPLTDEQKAELEEHKNSFDWGDGLGKPPEKKKEDEEDPEAGKKKEDEEEPDESGKKDKSEESDDDEKSEEKDDEDGKQQEEEESSEEGEQKQLSEEEQKAEDERLLKVSEEEGITVDQAKENEAKDKAIIDKYSGDPMKMARALRNENSAYGKVKAEADQLTAFKKQVLLENEQLNEKRIDEELQESREEIIDKYLETFKDQADESEDVIFERAKSLIKQNLRAARDEEVKEVRNQADQARENLVKSIADTDKEYADEVREILKKESDIDVLNPEYDVNNLVYWARGKKFTPDYVKSLKEAAYKKGMEDPKIKESKAAAHGGRRPAGKKTKTVTITASDRKRALQVFGHREDMSDDEKCAEYLKNHKQFDEW